MLLRDVYSIKYRPTPDWMLTALPIASIERPIDIQARLHTQPNPQSVGRAKKTAAKHSIRESERITQCLVQDRALVFKRQPSKQRLREKDEMRLSFSRLESNDYRSETQRINPCLRLRETASTNNTHTSASDQKRSTKKSAVIVDKRANGITVGNEETREDPKNDAAAGSERREKRRKRKEAHFRRAEEVGKLLKFPVNGPEISDILNSFTKEDIQELRNVAQDLRRDIENGDGSLRPVEEKIAEFALYLGMDLDVDQEFLPIAQWAMTAPLPPDWTAHRDQLGNPYFYNSRTETSHYEHPLDRPYKLLYQVLKAGRNECI